MSGGNDDTFEVLDLSALRRRDNWLEKLMGDVTRQSAARQVAIGGVSGWVAGYLFIKVGKVAAATLGTTILIIQIAQHQGYIQINWNRVNREMGEARRRMEREAGRNYPNVLNNLKRFARHNMFLAGSFAGGFLLGLAV